MNTTNKYINHTTGSPNGGQRRHAGAAGADGEPGEQQRRPHPAATAAAATPAHGAGVIARAPIADPSLVT